MRVVVHDYVGHPFQVQLSRELARRGYETLHLHFPGFETPKGELYLRSNDPPTFAVTGLKLRRKYKKYSFVSRYFTESEYGNVCGEAISAFNPDVVLSGNASPAIQKRLLKQCRKEGVPFVLWLQDLYGVAARRVLSRRFGLVGRLVAAQVARTEEAVIAGSNHVVYISEDFLHVSRAAKARRRSSTVIENWAPLEEMPLRPKANAWSNARELATKKVLLYSGTLGLKHNPNLLIQLALRFRQDDRIRVVVVSEGLGREWLEREKRRLALGNLMLCEFQPVEAFPDVLATGDVLLAIVEKEAGRFSVPSKVLSYHCAGRPLALAVPRENLAARTVVESDSGLVVEPDDIDGFTGACIKLLDDCELAERLGGNARRYAEATFNIERIASRFEAVFRDAMNSGLPG